MGHRAAGHLEPAAAEPALLQFSRVHPVHPEGSSGHQVCIRLSSSQVQVRHCCSHNAAGQPTGQHGLQHGEQAARSVRVLVHT